MYVRCVVADRQIQIEWIGLEVGRSIVHSTDAAKLSGLMNSGGGISSDSSWLGVVSTPRLHTGILPSR